MKGGELSYMALAMQRESNAYRSLLMQLGGVLADPEPVLARLRQVWASLLACPLIDPATALSTKK